MGNTEPYIVSDQQTPGQLWQVCVTETADYTFVIRAVSPAQASAAAQACVVQRAHMAGVRRHGPVISEVRVVPLDNPRPPL